MPGGARGGPPGDDRLGDGVDGVSGKGGVVTAEFGSTGDQRTDQVRWLRWEGSRVIAM